MDTTGLWARPVRLALDRFDDGQGRVRLAVTGEVDISSLEQLRGAIAGVLGGSGVTDLVIDLGSLDFIDSAGVQVLLGAKREADGQGITFSVANAYGKVLRVLTLLNLHEFLAASGRGAATAGQPPQSAR